MINIYLKVSDAERLINDSSRLLDEEDNLRRVGGASFRFNYNLRFAHDDATPGEFPPGISRFPQTDVPAGPSVFTLLEQQLGLKLVPDKGPREYLVIDSVQRPSEN
jgi:uncharacterized protein (TIGR03435 family)